MVHFAIIIWSLAVIFSILTKIIWWPDQVRKIYKEKSTKQISTIYIAIWLVSHSLWVAHWLIKNDFYLVIWQFLWVVLMWIILFQIYIYRNND